MTVIVNKNKTKHNARINPKFKHKTHHATHKSGFWSSIGNFFKSTARTIVRFGGSVEKKAETAIGTIYGDVKKVVSFGGNLVTKTRDDVVGVGKGIVNTGQYIVIGAVALIALIIFNIRGVASGVATIKQAL